MGTGMLGSASAPTQLENPKEAGGDLKILLDTLKGRDYSAPVTRKEAKAQTGEVT